MRRTRKRTRRTPRKIAAKARLAATIGQVKARGFRKEDALFDPPRSPSRVRSQAERANELILRPKITKNEQLKASVAQDQLTDNRLVHPKRGRGRPRKRKPATLGGFSNSVDTAGLQQLSRCVDTVLRDFFRDKAGPNDTACRSLVEKFVHELGHVAAMQDLRDKAKLTKRGQKPRFDLQAFLGQLEKHLNSADVKLAQWEWGEKERREAIDLAGKLLGCIGLDPPSFRQWRQRHFLR